ncbi:hypothetical protein BBK36DRAFT_1138102 [Trichoderma citrinoviride]|uniref:Uncharacterized protein n=1 Tax=Trichoderma citrinoviride TaxID=58853 RepID=A0A2T4BK45_9HYPO|nr:hypothetical protein BBK36DRAFT_1138102 [Trichoderma citrinoviride]PTB69678.1 hypothetical protein BBK36DRAFT_1138102 [Trichoderma citrinoviride]
MSKVTSLSWAAGACLSCKVASKPVLFHVQTCVRDLVAPGPRSWRLPVNETIAAQYNNVSSFKGSQYNAGQENQPPTYDEATKDTVPSFLRAKREGEQRINAKRRQQEEKQGEGLDRSILAYLVGKQPEGDISQTQQDKHPMGMNT